MAVRHPSVTPHLAKARPYDSPKVEYTHRMHKRRDPGRQFRIRFATEIYRNATALEPVVTPGFAVHSCNASLGWNQAPIVVEFRGTIFQALDVPV